MAVDHAHAQYYSENIGGGGFPMCTGFQEWWMNPVPSSSSSSSSSSSAFVLDASSNHPPQQLPSPPVYSLQDLRVGDHAAPLIPFSSSPAAAADKLLPTAFFSQSLADQVEAQSLEIDWLLRWQVEKMKYGLEEQGKQQLGLLLKRVEWGTRRVMREKEEEVGRARKNMMEMEEWLRRKEMEREGWERVAKEKEEMVKHLSNMLEQVRETQLLMLMSSNEDAESSYQLGGPTPRTTMEIETAAEKMKMRCKGCKSGRSCFLFLPCRHLCCCKTCEPLLASCPVCQSSKHQSMEVFLV